MPGLRLPNIELASSHGAQILVPFLAFDKSTGFTQRCKLKMTGGRDLSYRTGC